MSFPNPFDIGNLDGPNGFRIVSANMFGPYDAGSAVSYGDFNGDGLMDVLLGAPGDDGGAQNYPGGAYVIFGSTNPFSYSFSLKDINGTNGFFFTGINPNDYCGYSVSGIKDVNGDGIDDFIIGAPNANGGAGESYVVFGTRNGFPETLNASDLNGKNGFVVKGISKSGEGDASGASVSGAGDVNGDGINDFIIGAFNALNESGQAYIVYGSKAGFPAVIDLASPNNNVVTINGSNGGHLGSDVDHIGDLNKDGYSDVIISNGYFYQSSYSVVASVLYGSSDLPTTIIASDLQGKDGFNIITPSCDSGNVAALDDVNGDGYPDYSVAGYIVYDKSIEYSAIYNVTKGLGHTTAEIIDGCGLPISGVGDINNDGKNDILVGYPVNSGKSFADIIYGNTAGFSAAINLGTMDNATGFEIIGFGNSEGNPCTAVSGLGDVNGDNITDFAIALLGGGAYDYGNDAAVVVFGEAS